MTQRHWVQNEHLMFITTNLQHRLPLFFDAAYARVAVDMLYKTQEQYPFYLHAFVVMPDHCHVLLTPPHGGSVSRMLYMYKRKVSFELALGSIWQSRFDCRLVRSSSAVTQYIHENPVRAGLSNAPEDYFWSSASGKWDITPLDFMGCFT